PSTESYTLSLHDALPISRERSFNRRRQHREAGRDIFGVVLEQLDVEPPLLDGRGELRKLPVKPEAPVTLSLSGKVRIAAADHRRDRKSTRLNSSHVKISY